MRMRCDVSCNTILVKQKGYTGCAYHLISAEIFPENFPDIFYGKFYQHHFFVFSIWEITFSIWSTRHRCPSQNACLYPSSVHRVSSSADFLADGRRWLAFDKLAHEVYVRHWIQSPCTHKLIAQMCAVFLELFELKGKSVFFFW